MTAISIADGMFYAAFILDLIIFYFAFSLYRQIKGSTLASVALYASLSAFVFGLHHLGEVLFHDSVTGITIAESIESVAALLLLIAIYYLYKVSNEIFVAKYYTISDKK